MLVIGPWNVPQLIDVGKGEIKELVDFKLNPASHTATLLQDGSVLVLGGRLNQGGNTGAWLFDPRRNTFRVAPEPALERSNHTATLLADGQVLVVGGAGPNEARAELFDPVNEKWQLAGLTSSPRTGHEAVLLDDGRVLIYGGGNYQGRLDAVEIYDPATRQWTGVGSIPDFGVLGPGVPLPDGNVLVVSSRGQEAWLFRPNGAHWEGTLSGDRSRHDYSIAMLLDGRVVVLGGQTSGSDRTPLLLASSEAFDPQTKTWRPAPPLLEPRGGHTATLLPDGSVLIFGGYGIRDNPPPTEIYHAF